MTANHDTFSIEDHLELKGYGNQYNASQLKAEYDSLISKPGTFEKQAYRALAVKYGKTVRHIRRIIVGAR